MRPTTRSHPNRPRQLAALALLAALSCGDDDTSSKPPANMRDAAPANMRDAAAELDGSRLDASAPVSFSKDIAPLFEERCVICHRAGSVIELDLHDPFDPEHGLINRINSWHVEHESPFEFVVKPGAPDDSFLIYKVAANPDAFDTANNGNPMPFAAQRVTGQALADIKQWITDGALDDAFFAQKVAPVFGTQVTLGSKSGRCTFCHYPGSPTGLDILAVFDPTTGLVGADSDLSDKPRVAPGDPDGSFLIEKLEQQDPSGGKQMPLHYDRLSATEVGLLRAWIEQGARND